jgi:protein ImuA
MQGFKMPAAGTDLDIGLGPVAAAFPNNSFPQGAVHEFISDGPEAAAATSGFVNCLLGGLMKGGKVCVWISGARSIFPPALKVFGVAPEQIIFIDLPRRKEQLWAMEEALKCEGLAAVVAEIPEIDFTASRRLQLAVEKSRVTGFLLRQQPRSLQTIAVVARWKIISLPSKLNDGMPGIGFPSWEIELQKIRNGKPGSWQMEWGDGRFQCIQPAVSALPASILRKTG